MCALVTMQYEVIENNDSTHFYNFSLLPLIIESEV